GHGKRRNVLSDYTFAVIDDRRPTTDQRPPTTQGESLDSRNTEHATPHPTTQLLNDPTTLHFVNIGKAYGGLTDAMILEMTERLKGITVQDFGRYRAVRPEIVLEVEFNNIMKSSRHKSGYALRFPRIVRVRDDKTPADVNTLSDVERMYAALTGEST